MGKPPQIIRILRVKKIYSVLQLLSPFWLVALAALAVPVALHLWHKKPGRVVRVGSIRWLQATASQRRRSLRLTEIGLLVLRCLLLAALALALTQPRWLVAEKVNPPSFVFIAPELRQTAAFAAHRPTVDSLLRHGYTLRWWQPGFAPIRPADWPQPAGSDSLVTAAVAVNYWQLIRELPPTLPRSRRHWVFAPAHLAHFQGARPASVPLTWVPVAVPTTKTWLPAAFLLPNNQLLLLLGTGNEKEISYEKRVVTLPATGSSLRVAEFPNLRLLRRQNQLLVQLAPGQAPVVVRQKPFAVAVITAPDRAEDERVLVAALRAVQDFTQIPLQITQQKLPAQPNWIFWLTNEKLPAAVQKQVRAGATVWQDAPAATTQNTTGWFTGFTQEPRFALTKQGTLPAGPAVWRTYTGATILSAQAVGQGRQYRFGSRFHPAWSTLAESEAFPELLLQLLLTDALTNDQASETRMIADNQIIPIQKTSTKKTPTAALKTSRDLRSWFVGLALLLLVAERFWAYRKGKLPAE